jgi:hypothetical protein
MSCAETVEQKDKMAIAAYRNTIASSPETYGSLTCKSKVRRGKEHRNRVLGTSAFFENLTSEWRAVSPPYFWGQCAGRE